MSDSMAETIRPFDEIPIITRPDDYSLQLPEFLARMAQEHGPIFRRRMDDPMQTGLGPWIVYMVGPEANRFVMHTQRDHFSHEQGWTPEIGPLFEKGLLNTDDPEHAYQRKMMNPAFAIAYMSRYIPIMQRIMADRTRDWAARGNVDMYQEARKITFDVAAEALVGFQTGAQVDRLREVFNTMLNGDFDFTSEQEAIATFTSLQSQLKTLLLAMIAERRAAPTDDILGLLIQARNEDGKGFSDLELIGQLEILLVAGHETTTSMSAWLFYLLAQHPDYLQRVQQELRDVLGTTDGAMTLEKVKALPILSRAIDETGRLYSPVGNVPRGVLKDFVFNGYRVPAGEVHLILSLAGCHRLPTIFAEPGRFDPDRFAPPREEDKRTPYALVPFGGGPRICIGINFAQIEIKVMAAHILQHFTLAPVADAQPLQAYYGPTANIVGGLLLHVTPRQA